MERVLENDKLPFEYRINRRIELNEFYERCGIKNRKILVTDVYNYIAGEELSFLRNNEVDFIDNNPEYISIAREMPAHSGINFFLSDVRDIASVLGDKYYDIIISESTLDHFEKEYFEDAIKSLLTLLKTGSVIYLLLNNKYDFLFYTAFKLDAFLKRETAVFYSVKEVINILDECGMKVVGVEYMFFCMSWRVLFGHFFSKVCNFFAAGRGRRFFSPQFMVVAVKE